MYTKVDAALRHLVATNLVALLFTDLSGNILDADESFLNLLGYSSENLPRSIHDLTPPEHHRLDDEAFEKLMAFGACAPYEKEFLNRMALRFPSCLAPHCMKTKSHALSSTSLKTVRLRKS